jgi:3-hydroxyisobutyrate dehydrogenase-like beta-hydroxyacid dehydrogenase
MNIGFIGFGEVGYEMSQGFLQDGIKEIIAYDPMYDNDFVKERAKAAGVKLVANPVEVLQPEVEIVIVAVPAHHAKNAWESIHQNLTDDILCVDVSTASATVKAEIDKKLLENKGMFVDAALMGPLSVHKHKVPIIASGGGVDRFEELMTPYNMNIEKVSNIPGDATNIKFTRSIYMKGIAALLSEVLELAHELNIADRVVSSISKTMDEKPFAEIINRLITGTAIHSGRRVIELDNVIELLEEHNIAPIMTMATKEKHIAITNHGLRSKFNDKTPDDWKLVIEEMNKKVSEEIGKV